MAFIVAKQQSMAIRTRDRIARLFRDLSLARNDRATILFLSTICPKDDGRPAEAKRPETDKWIKLFTVDSIVILRDDFPRRKARS